MNFCGTFGSASEINTIFSHQRILTAAKVIPVTGCAEHFLVRHQHGMARLFDSDVAPENILV